MTRRALVLAWLALSLSACEGTVIDGGTSSASGAAGKADPPPAEVRKSFFGRLVLRALTRTTSPSGTEVTPRDVGVTFELNLSESGSYSLDDGTTCIRGFYAFQSGGARGALTFEPAIGRAGPHDVEFLDAQVAVADVLTGYPWARLEPASTKNRCDSP